ncbi:PQQ-dependent sugar dehydrogenase [Tuwongella immobilis]|nr:PQQ-dependent sugar dehydrogenase [Tuwongella immobilis]
MDFAPDGRLYVTEQSGTVRVIDNGVLLPELFITVEAGTASEFGEQGLLGIKFHPDYLENGHFYLYYTTPDSTLNRVSRFTATESGVELSSELVIVEYPSATSHNAGGLHFGPDGKLYIATGDAVRENTVQSLTALNGKMLRFNPDGTIPEDNPFYTQTTGIHRSIWATGLRNPFTFAIHPETGVMFINDVGLVAYEEVNQGFPGANYGWPLSEGPTTDPRFISPIYSYAHVGTGYSIAGAAFYVPPVANFPQEYVGDYFFGDFLLRFLKRMDPVTGEVTDFATELDYPVDLDVGPDGALYYLGRTGDLTRGRVIRIGYDPEAPPSLFSEPEDVLASVSESVTLTAQGVGAGTLSYQWQRNGVDLPGETNPTLVLGSVGLADSGAEFQVVITSEFGIVTSRVATLTVLDNARPTIEIESPALSQRFVAGETIEFAFQGLDVEDGVLDPSQVTYRVDYHTGAAVRPLVLPRTGVTSGEFTIPDRSPYKTADVFFRIHISVVDSVGLTATTFRDILPQTAMITVESDFPGTIRLDGQPIVTPLVFEGVSGLQRSLEALPEIIVEGERYRFTGWSNGANQFFEFPTPLEDTTLRATYERVTAEDEDSLPTDPTDPADPTDPITSFQDGPQRPLTQRTFAVTALAGISAEVRLFDATGEIGRIIPFSGDFAGPSRATTGFVLGNSDPEVLVVAGAGGGPILEIYSGTTFQRLESLLVFEDSFRGGLYVTTGDLTGDGLDEIVVSADFGGGPRIRIYEGGSLQVIADFFGIDDPDFRGGARVAVGDLNGDGIVDLMVAAGPTGGPRIALFDGSTLRSPDGPVKLIGDFFAFEPELRDGTYPALGDLNDDGSADLIFGAGPGGGPRVLVLDAARVLQSGGTELLPLANFFNGDINSRSGIRVAVRDFDGVDSPELVLASRDETSAYIDLVQPLTLSENGEPNRINRFRFEDPNFQDGIFVG